MTSRVKTNLLAQKAAFQRLSRKISRNPLQAGFTLIELLIVVIIIGVLASIALPAFLNQQNRARVQAANSSAMDAARSCAALQITSQESSFSMPSGVTSAAAAPGCVAPTAAITFRTADITVSKLTTAAAATVATSGSVTMVTCAGATGVDGGTAPNCS